MTMEELLSILQDLHPEVDFATCDRLIDDKILDSFDIISLITELSETFEITVPASEIIPENFNSANALWALVQKLLDE